MSKIDRNTALLNLRANTESMLADDGLWFEPKTVPEKWLQGALECILNDAGNVLETCEGLIEEPPALPKEPNHLVHQTTKKLRDHFFPDSKEQENE